MDGEASQWGGGEAGIVAVVLRDWNVLHDMFYDRLARGHHLELDVHRTGAGQPPCWHLHAPLHAVPELVSTVVHVHH